MTTETKHTPTYIKDCCERAIKHIQPYGPNKDGYKSDYDIQSLTDCVSIHDKLVEVLKDVTARLKVFAKGPLCLDDLNAIEKAQKILNRAGAK